MATAPAPLPEMEDLLRGEPPAQVPPITPLYPLPYEEGPDPNAYMRNYYNQRVAPKGSKPLEPGELPPFTGYEQGEPRSITGRAAGAVLEPVATVATGFTGMVAGGIGGIGRAVAGAANNVVAKLLGRKDQKDEFMQNAVKVIQDVQETLSYQPKTPEGKAVTDVLMIPFAMGKHAADSVQKWAYEDQIKQGMSPEQARFGAGLLASAVEIATLALLDKGVRTGFRTVRSRVSRFTADLRTRGIAAPDTLESARELVDAVGASTDPALVAARQRLVNTLGQIRSQGQQNISRLQQVLEARAQQRIDLSGGVSVNPQLMPSLRAMGRDILLRLGENPDNAQTISDAAAYRMRIASTQDPTLLRIREQIDAYVRPGPEAPPTTAAIPPTAEVTTPVVPTPAAPPTPVPRTVPAVPQAPATRIAPAVRTPLEAPVSPVPVAPTPTAPEATRVLPAELPVPVERITPRVEVAPVATPELPAPISRARELLGRAGEAGISSAERNSALAELKGIVREGLRPREATRIGLEREGFSPGEITELEPQLRRVRAIQRPESTVERLAPAVEAEESRLDAAAVRAPVGSTVEVPAEAPAIDTTPVIAKPKRTRKLIKEEPSAEAEMTPGEEEVFLRGAVREQQANQRIVIEGAVRASGLSLDEASTILTESFQRGIRPIDAAEELVRRGVSPDDARTAAGVAYDLFSRGRAISRPAQVAATGPQYYARATSLADVRSRARQPLADTGTAVPDPRANLQVRASAGGAPDAILINTRGLNTLSSAADIERQLSRRMMSPETAQAIRAQLERQATLGDTTIDAAHHYNAERFTQQAARAAEELGMELYIKKGDAFEQVPTDVVKTFNKLNHGDAMEPSTVSAADGADYVEFQTRPIGARLAREVVDAVERGEDLTSSLSGELLPHYKQLQATWKQGLDESAPRRLIDILRDINTLIGERGAIGPGGPLSRERRLAAQRLEGDARKVGGSFRDFFSGLLGPREAPMFERYLELISNPNPPEGLGPRQRSLDSQAAARGEMIVNQRDITSTRKAPPNYESDVTPLYNSTPVTNLSPAGLTDNPYYQLRSAGVLDPFYYAYRTMQKNLTIASNAMRKDLLDLSKSYSYNERVRVQQYGYAQTPQGMNILIHNGVRDIPALTPKEIALYDTLSEVQRALFDEVNLARKASGLEEIPPIDNHFTFARAYNLMERLNKSPDLARASATDIMNAYVSHVETAYPYKRLRTGATYTAEMDAFTVMDRYSQSALKQIHTTPFTAKVSELIDHPLPDPIAVELSKAGAGPITQADMTWKLREQNPSLYNTLFDWKEYIATGESRWFRFPRPVESVMTMLGNNLAASMLSGVIRSAGIQISTIRGTVLETGLVNTGRTIGEMVGDILSGSKLWNEALQKSEILSVRNYTERYDSVAAAIVGRNPSDFIRALAQGRWLELQRSIANLGLKPLELMDMTASVVTWRSAYNMAKKAGTYTEKQAIRLADDVVLRTQGSGMPGDLAALQRSAAGKLVTQFQTFVINDFNFMARDVLGVKNPAVGTQQAMSNMLKLIGLTTAFNVLFEDVLHLQSPFPTPLRDIQRGIDEGETGWALAARLSGTAIEPFPIASGARYGRGVTGPIFEKLRDFARGVRGDPVSPNPLETAAIIAGVPGTQQYSKTVRGIARGENAYDSLTGWYTLESQRRRATRPQREEKERVRR